MTDDTGFDSRVLLVANRLFKEKFEKKYSVVHRSLNEVFKNGELEDRSKFVHQCERIDTELAKVRKLGPSDLQTRLTASSLLALNIFDILEIDIASFFKEINEQQNTLSYLKSENNFDEEITEEREVETKETDRLSEILGEMREIKAFMLEFDESNNRTSYIHQWNNLCRYNQSLQVFFSYYNLPSTEGFNKMLMPQLPLVNTVNNLMNFENKQDSEKRRNANLELWLAQYSYQKVKNNSISNSYAVVYFEKYLLNTYAQKMKREGVFKKYFNDVCFENNDIEHHRLLLPLLLMYAFAIHFNHFINLAIVKREKYKKVGNTAFALFKSANTLQYKDIEQTLRKLYSDFERICKVTLLKIMKYSPKDFVNEKIENEKYLCEFILLSNQLFLNFDINTEFHFFQNQKRIQQSFEQTLRFVESFYPGKTITYKVADVAITGIEEFKNRFKKYCEDFGQKIVDSKYYSRQILTLKPIQVDAINHIKNTWKDKHLENGQIKSPVCALDMGSGKTVVACEIIKYFREELTDTTENSYILIIAKASTIDEPWQKELKKYFAAVIPAIKNDRSSFFNRDDYTTTFQENEIVITSYDTASNDIGYYLNNPPELIVYDEIQCVNSSKKMVKRCKILGELNSKVDYKLALTGTPAQNSDKEFLITYFFLNDYHSLKKWFATGKSKQNKEEKNALYDKACEIIFKGSFYIFSLLDFQPAEFNNTIPVEIGTVMNENYKKLVEHRNSPKKNFISNQTIMQYLIYPGILNNKKYLSIKNFLDINTEIRSKKLDIVRNIVKNIPADSKIIVFSYYRQPLIELEQVLSEYNPLLLVGKKDDEKYSIQLDKRIKREEIINQFKDASKNHRVLLTTLKMSGEGLNLQMANHIIIMDMWWNPMTILQAIARIRRQDQTKNIFCYSLVYSKLKEERQNAAELLMPDGSNSKDYLIDHEYNIMKVMARKIKQYNNFLIKLGSDAFRNLPAVSEKEITPSEKQLLDFLKSIGAVTISGNQSQNNQPTIRSNPNLLKQGPIPQRQLFSHPFWGYWG